MSSYIVLSSIYLEKAYYYLSQLETEYSVRHFISLHLWQEMTDITPDADYQILTFWKTSSNKKDVFTQLKDGRVIELHNHNSEKLRTSLALRFQKYAELAQAFIEMLKNGLPLSGIKCYYDDPGGLAKFALRQLYNDVSEFAAEQGNEQLLAFLGSLDRSDFSYRQELYFFMEADRLRLSRPARNPIHQEIIL